MSRGSKQTAKDDILAATRKLLTQDGSVGASMRDIAAELGISVGNLTYYYKTKIELMEAVVLELHKSAVPNIVPKNLEDLDAMFRAVEDKHNQRYYYFKNYALFAKESERIRELQSGLWQSHRDTWREIMQNLCAAGLVTQEEYAGQFGLFIDGMQFMILYRNSRAEADAYMGLTAPPFTECMWSLFFPLLTEQGKNIYMNRIKNQEESR